MYTVHVVHRRHMWGWLSTCSLDMHCWTRRKWGAILISRVEKYISMIYTCTCIYLGMRNVSCLARCPYFRGAKRKHSTNRHRLQNQELRNKCTVYTCRGLLDTSNSQFWIEDCDSITHDILVWLLGEQSSHGISTFILERHE